MPRPAAVPQDLTKLIGSLTAAARTAGPPGPAPDPHSAAPREASVGAAAAIEGPDAPAATAFSGTTALFAADGSVLPEDAPAVEPVTERTLFDLASVTKILTALTAATLIDDGVLDVHQPVRELMPAPRPDITVHHLLTHTSGLPPVMPLWRMPGGREARLDAVRSATLDHAPGEAHAYSCIGFILLGALMEALTDTPLPELARRRVLDPAGATGVTWTPDTADAAHAAATEHQEDPPRGLVRGSTHDETAWSLGGAGNAGAFATLPGALAIGRILAGRALGPRLSPAVRELLTADQLPGGPATDAPWRQGLGLRIGQETAPGRLAEHVVGHPGFTGTSIHADPRTGTVAVLLTNRVHPYRSWFTVEAARRDLARLAFA